MDYPPKTAAMCGLRWSQTANISISAWTFRTLRAHSHLFELCDHFIVKYEWGWLNGWQAILPGSQCSLHYWTVGSAGWLVDWVMIEHAACQPPWLANWLTNWLPAWLNDDLTYNLPLLQPAGHNDSLTTPDATFTVKSSNGQITWQSCLRAMRHSLTVPPAALRSLLSLRNQYPTMIKLDVAYWL